MNTYKEQMKLVLDLPRDPPTKIMLKTGSKAKAMAPSIGSANILDI